MSCRLVNWINLIAGQWLMFFPHILMSYSTHWKENESRSVRTTPSCLWHVCSSIDLSLETKIRSVSEWLYGIKQTLTGTQFPRITLYWSLQHSFAMFLHQQLDSQGLTGRCYSSKWCFLLIRALNQVKEQSTALTFLIHTFLRPFFTCSIKY